MRESATCIIGFIVTAVAGCAVGPNYKRPDPPMPAEWSGLHSPVVTTQPAVPTTQPTAQPADLAQWWRNLNDPALDSLIARAIASNLDLRVAAARIREARAERDSAAAGLLPHVNVSTSSQYSGASLNSGPKSSGDTSALQDARDAAINSAMQSLAGGQGIDPASIASSAVTQGVNQALTHRFGKTEETAHRGQNLFQAGFDATWELDVFGGIRRGVEAAEADTAAAVEDRRAVVVSLVSEVALNYVQLRGYQRRLQIARHNIDVQRETVGLTQQRLSAEFASQLEVAQAKAQLATTTAQVPALQDSIRQTIHQLGVLLGQPPGALIAELEQSTPLPMSPPEVPIGLPSDLLRRRPDIRSAERQLAATTARIGEAVADLFPKFSLSGSFGAQSRDIRHLLERDSLGWSIGPAISWPIFQGGAIRANIAIQNARQEQALATYEQTVITALKEVEDTLSAYSTEQVRRQSLEEAVTNSQEATDLSMKLYTGGMSGFLNVLNAQGSLYSSQDALVQSDTTVVTNLIALYKALGGGWEE